MRKDFTVTRFSTALVSPFRFEEACARRLYKTGVKAHSKSFKTGAAANDEYSKTGIIDILLPFQNYFPSRKRLLHGYIPGF